MAAHHTCIWRCHRREGTRREVGEGLQRAEVLLHAFCCTLLLLIMLVALPVGTEAVPVAETVESSGAIASNTIVAAMLLGAACPGLRRARPRLHLSPQERCSALKRTERDLLKRVLKDTWFTYFEPPRFLLQKWDSRGFCGACAWVSTWGG